MEDSNIPGVIVLASRRRVLERLLASGATSPHAAQPLKSLSSFEQHELERLQRAEVVRDAGNAHYYVDESALTEYRADRRRLAILALIVAAIIGFVVARLVT